MPVFMNTALEKIKKLLRMKRGGTQAEIETALALAQQIAAKHVERTNSQRLGPPPSGPRSFTAFPMLSRNSARARFHLQSGKP
jgi:hypothetical protein